MADWGPFISYSSESDSINKIHLISDIFKWNKGFNMPAYKTKYWFSLDLSGDSDKKKMVVLLRWVLVITASCIILFSNGHKQDFISELVVLSLLTVSW